MKSTIIIFALFLFTCVFASSSTTSSLDLEDFKIIENGDKLIRDDALTKQVNRHVVRNNNKKVSYVIYENQDVIHNFLFNPNSRVLYIHKNLINWLKQYKKSFDFSLITNNVLDNFSDLKFERSIQSNYTAECVACIAGLSVGLPIIIDYVLLKIVDYLCAEPSTDDGECADWSDDILLISEALLPVEAIAVIEVCNDTACDGTL